MTGPGALALRAIAATAAGGVVGLAVPYGTRLIVERFAPEQALLAIVGITLALILAGIAAGVLAYAGGTANQRFWIGWERRRILAGLDGLVHAAADLQPAAVLERLRGAAQAREALARAGITAFGSAAILAASGGYLLSLAPELGAAVLTGLVLTSAMAAYLLHRQTIARIDAAEAESTATGFLSAALRVRQDGGGIPVSLEAQWLALHSTRMTASQRAQAWRDAQRALDAGIAALAPAGLIAAAYVLTPDLPAGELAAAYAAFGQCLMAAFGLSWALAGLAQAEEGRRMLASLPRSASVARPVPAPSGPALEMTGVAFAYPGSPALFSDLSLRLDAGQSLALTGPSGSGKSTLVRLVAGLLAPDRGSVRLSGADPRDLDPGHRGAFLGVIGAAVPDFRGTLPQETGASTALAWATGVTENRRAQIALARAFAGDPRLIVLDEAFRSEDAPILDEIFERAERTGAALLIVTHDPAVAARCTLHHTLGPD